MNLDSTQSILLLMVVVAIVLIMMNRTAGRAAQRLNDQIETAAREDIRQRLVADGMPAAKAEAEAARQAKEIVREREKKSNRGALIFAGVYVLVAIIVYLFDPLLGVIIAFFAIITLGMALWQFFRLRRSAG